MGRVYLIPGLGADSRIYNKIDLQGHEVTSVDWIDPDKTDTLATYSQKLINHYHIDPKSILIGNSMGGMIAMEIAKIIAVEKVILISSIRNIDEAPAYFGFFKAMPLYKLIPEKTLNAMGFLIKPLFGHMQPDDALLFADMLKKSSPVFLKWAMGAVVNWDNKTISSPVCQVIGDKDLVFPYKKQPAAEVIKGGTHIMIFEMADAVNKWLKGVLAK